MRQWEVIEAHLRSLNRRDLTMIDVGCGTGWACERLLPFGKVTGVDMAPSVIGRARSRLPEVRFECGDFHALDLGRASFDLVLCLEVLSHVEDQARFLDRCASLLRPGGQLILCTQNRPVLERWDAVAPPDPNQIRKWLDARELKALLGVHFKHSEIRSLYPVGHRGILRWVNAPKINAVANAMLGGSDRVMHLKERAGLGHSLLAIAQRG